MWKKLLKLFSIFTCCFPKKNKIAPSEYDERNPDEETVSRENTDIFCVKNMGPLQHEETFKEPDGKLPTEDPVNPSQPQVKLKKSKKMKKRREKKKKRTAESRGDLRRQLCVTDMKKKPGLRGLMAEMARNLVEAAKDKTKVSNKKAATASAADTSISTGDVGAIATYKMTRKPKRLERGPKKVTTEDQGIPHVRAAQRRQVQSGTSRKKKMKKKMRQKMARGRNSLKETPGGAFLFTTETKVL